MREIKFRAWDAELTMMWSEDEVCTHEDIWNIGTNKKNFPNNVLMQYTGLKDKNGKEIYEGDVVRGNTVHGFVVVPMLGGLSVLSVLNFGQEHNELIASPTNDAQTASWLRESEVIGNAYEHPELLKEPK